MIDGSIDSLLDLLIEKEGGRNEEGGREEGRTGCIEQENPHPGERWEILLKTSGLAYFVWEFSLGSLTWRRSLDVLRLGNFV